MLQSLQYIQNFGCLSQLKRRKHHHHHRRRSRRQCASLCFRSPPINYKSQHTSAGGARKGRSLSLVSSRYAAALHEPKA
ncbi:hypothetical protein E2C01_064656 [Portunus trituberculatus]|uniref:Uncharacterized protein n=1 Tax=Portunus trituberculatus TaxID=210409 RepID=A0A5B7HMG1_PORTR|nr:hypothetical protein [Portunus trituberculatus]